MARRSLGSADPRRNRVLAERGREPGQISREHHDGVEYVAFG
ncbi:MAG: hypothetical protein ACXWZW_00040 [Solirubrobacterales bacterium]